MPREKGSVLSYTKAKITVEVNFPDDDIACHQCRFYKYSDTYERGYCDIMTHESNMSKKYAMSNIHPDCPLVFEEGNHE